MMINCFFAFSDKGNTVSSSINAAIREINGKSHISIIPWNTMGIEGEFIPGKIKESIDKCDYFLCDNSNLNDNVLFELGYAIGKEKPVRIYINPSLKDVKETVRKLDILSTIGYQEYSNSQQLTKLIWELSTKKRLFF